MTTVAALAVDGTVAMAADSLTNVYERPIVDGARKIRRLRVGAGEALIGVCGAGGIADVVAYRLTCPEAPGQAAEDVGRWASAVGLAVTELAVEAGLTDEGKLDATLLLGYRGRLWTLTHALAIPIRDGVAALGSGEGPAMGALDVLRDRLPPEDACRRAVEISCIRDRNTAAPIYVESLTPEHGGL